MVRLAVVDGHPVRVELGHGIRASRVKWCRFVLRRGRQPEHFRCRGLVEASRQAHRADRLQQPRRAKAIRVARVFGLVERDLDVALRRQVVDLVRPHCLDKAVQPTGVRHVAVMQHEL